MELTELINKILQSFEIKNIGELKDKLSDICLNNKFEFYEKFKSIVEDLSIDWLQKIFQYYESDRIDLKQDYTPKCLAELISKITNNNETECIDMCAGSGALTIQKWNQNKNIKFVCKEYDKNVIPYLLFNLALRNINATVQRIDVLQNEIYEEYILISGDEFSRIEVINENTD